MPDRLDEVGRTGSARRRILEFLLDNPGVVLDGSRIREASGGITEWARRVRELRDEFGYEISSHKDLDALKPGQYMLRSAHRRPAAPRSISKETRAWVLERDGYTCQMCGRGAADADPTSTFRRTRLAIGHIIDKSDGGPDTADNLRAVCEACNSGLQNTSPPKPRRVELMKQLRRATIEDQRCAFEWLKSRFGKPAED